MKLEYAYQFKNRIQFRLKTYFLDFAALFELIFPFFLIVIDDFKDDKGFSSFLESDSYVI